ncbi:homeobox protein Mohawk-like [Morone saxatilis]|uniref:homeobox protein Mohawk-like n=1 Tax=Morone saxatilis TaxID=34816 RepID=UPI0015E1FD9B|nr:homeobox protein Mohawk-like [Morone saxatilis]
MTTSSSPQQARSDTHTYTHLLSLYIELDFNKSSLTPEKSAKLTFFFPLVLSETTDHGSSKCDNGSGGVGVAQKEKVKGKDETYWREINAAMALTNLAQGKDSASGTTSCIIQKSSHIAEIKTVKVPLMQKY